jgi:7-carboxy-7-deazaguanine synthase
MYYVKEIFYTLQGEGAQVGRSSVLCRFSRCNLWTGRESQRDSAICKFCDTDFVGTDGPNGGRFASPSTLAAAVSSVWGGERNRGACPYVVCTGGEPLLQLDVAAVDAFHEAGFLVGVETNGTLSVPKEIDWVTVSPKAQAPLLVESGNELKLVYPQVGAEPERFGHLDFEYFWLQPMDGPDRQRNTAHAIEYCLLHPRWRLSLQTHKYTGMP